MRHFQVKKQEDGVRLDKLLVLKMRELSRNNIKELIDRGRIKVNGQKIVIAKWEMSEGDNVDVRLDGWTPEDKANAAKKGKRDKKDKPKIAGYNAAHEFVNIIFEDRDVMVVDKPVGAVIQQSREYTGERTYVDSLKAYLKRKYKSKGAYVSPVHRLDKETSGLMVFAKSRVGEKLIPQFKNHTVEREYYALVEGRVDKESGTINLPIQKGDFGHGRKAAICKKGEGADSITMFRVRERYSNATLLDITMKTGRIHQARVHLSEIGHPIIGDRVYGIDGEIKFPRQALHSSKLSFRHPATGKVMKFTLDLPEDMKRIVDELRGY